MDSLLVKLMLNLINLEVNVDNKVFPGWGRTWNLGFTYQF